MTLNRILGATALALGVGAALTGNLKPGQGQSIAVDELAMLVGSQQDHVSARQLATWIKDGKAGLRVIDVRSAEDFARFSIPSAESIPIDAIPRAAFSDTDTVILYSEGGAHAAQAWVFLKAMGVRNVYFVAGGLSDWFDEVMYPVLPGGAEGARSGDGEALAELSRFFGGAPRAISPGVAGSDPQIESGAADLDDVIARARRRGC